jgi:Arc/MetJ-type ribon-helix-helix transcriptional regulator
MQAYDVHERLMNPENPTYLSASDALRAARRQLEQPHVKKIVITKIGAEGECALEVEKKPA